jgi:hypothetical protein
MEGYLRVRASCGALQERSHTPGQSIMARTPFPIRPRLRGPVGRLLRFLTCSRRPFDLHIEEVKRGIFSEHAIEMVCCTLWIHLVRAETGQFLPANNAAL